MRRIFAAFVVLSAAVFMMFGISSEAQTDADYSKSLSIDEFSEQLLQKYPGVEAIKKQFGDEANWRRTTESSPHEEDLELISNTMEYPGIEIRTMEYTYQGEDRFFITLTDVTKAGFVTFLGIDIGSSEEDVVKNWGSPDETSSNKLTYNALAYSYTVFTIENNKVARMTYTAPLD